MRFEYDHSPVRWAVIGAAVVAVLSLLLSDSLFQLIGLSIAAGPAMWALVQWRRRGHGVVLDDNVLTLEFAFTGRKRSIPYVDMLGCTYSDDQGLIVAYLRRAQQQSNAGDYPAISRVALAQARPPAGIRRNVVSTPRLKDIRGCLTALSEHLPQNPPALAEKYSTATLRSLAVRRNRINVLLLLLALLATPIYVIIITRLVTIFIRGK